MGTNGKICVQCKVELRPKQNGVSVIEMGTMGPISVRNADLWHCPSCGFEAVIGVSANPLFVQIQDDLAAEIQRLKDQGVTLIPFWLNGLEKADYEAYEAGNAAYQV